MSCMKNLFLKDMYDLADASGYDFDFLMDIYTDMMNDPYDDGDWDSFVATTLERDW